MKVEQTTYEKVNGKWVECYHTEDEKEVEHNLLHIIVSKKIFGRTYVHTIKQEQLYNGFRKFTCYLDDTKAEYIVKDSWN